jgi:phage terminase large subunit-like protein
MEWSAKPGSHLDDMEAWKQANPAMGRSIHYENLMAVKNEPEAVVLTENLGIWVDTMVSPWSPGAWSNSADQNLQLTNDRQTFLAFDLTPRRDRCALVASQIGDLAGVEAFELQRSRYFTVFHFLVPVVY